MGKGAKAPTPYQPAYQGQADSAYQAAVGGVTPYASSLPGQVIPGMATAAGNVAANPYNAGAQSGAGLVSDLATQYVAPNMINASGGMQGLGDLASMYAGAAGAGGQYAQPLLQGAVGAGQEAAQTGRAAFDRGSQISNMALGMVPTAWQGGVDHANTAWDQTQAAIPGLTQGMGYADQVMQSGFDPQQALYGREYQQMQDQQNAINSMYGVSGSAYGAGVAGDASRNFNIDWQNNQLGRQLSALQGYNQTSGQVTSNMTGLLNTGGGLYNSLMGGATDRANSLMNTSSTSMNQGVDNYRQGLGTYLNSIATGTGAYDTMMGGAVRDFGNMVNTAGGAYGQAGAQGADALNTLTTGTQLPAATYNAQQLAALQAYQALASGAGTAMQPSLDVAGAEGKYLGIGQNATALAQNAVQINNAARAATMGAITSTLGTIAGIALAPATGGLSLFGTMGAMGAGASATAANGAAFKAAGGFGG